jgi:hypothetical protein
VCLMRGHRIPLGVGGPCLAQVTQQRGSLHRLHPFLRGNIFLWEEASAGVIGEGKKCVRQGMISGQI